jgi:hypothetical protein
MVTWSPLEHGSHGNSFAMLQVQKQYIAPIPVSNATKDSQFTCMADSQGLVAQGVHQQLQLLQWACKMLFL